MNNSIESILSNKKTSLAIILLITFIVYFNTLNNKYALDDYYVTAQNPDVQKGIAGIPHLFNSYYAKDGDGKGFEYRPIVKVTYAIEFSLFGENPMFSHLINLILYILNISLLFTLLLRILEWQQNYILIFLASLIFALLPAHTEVVDNLKSRDELLQFSFGILCLLVSISDYKIAVRIILCFLLFALALLSKLSSVYLIAIIPLTIYYKETKKGLKKIFLFLGVLLICFGGFYLFSTTYFSSVRNINFSENPLAYASLDKRLATSMVVLLHYIKLLLLPGTHSFYYGFNMIPVVGFNNGAVIFSILFHAFILWWALINIVKKKPLAYAILFYLLAIFPFSNIIFPVPGILGERFTYVASVGFCIAFSWFTIFLANKIKKPKSAFGYLAIPVVIILYFSYDIIDRNRDWKDLVTLYEADIPHLSKSSHANYLYALSLEIKADSTYSKPERNKIYNKALNYYKKVDNRYWEGQKNIAKIYFYLGNNAMALKYIHNAYNLTTETKRKLILDDRVAIEEANGNFAENIKLLNQYLVEDPDNVTYNYYLMRNHLFLNGDTTAAGKYARKVIALNKNGYYANRARGLLYIINNDIANNIKYSEIAFEQNPSDTELGNYLYNYYKENNNSFKEKYYLNALKKQRPKPTL